MGELVRKLKREGVLRTPSVIAAFTHVDRKDFVPEELAAEAYYDEALPIGEGQTISQPYTVAFMLELLGALRGEKVLDVGAGSGWTTALLAHIVGPEGNVLGTERVPELLSFGQRNLAKYDFANASIVEAGDVLGLPEEAPFDRTLASASAASVPKGLVEQLKVGGTMVIPVGSAIQKVVRTSETETSTEPHEGFAFVPLIESE